MRAYLSFENDYDHGDELLGVFETLDQAQSLIHAYRAELWEGPVMKQAWEKRNGGWMKVAW